MKNTLGRVAHPSFLVSEHRRNCGAPSMTQLHRAWVGPHHSPRHFRRSNPHQPERRLVEEDIAFRVVAADNQPNFRTISDFPQDPFDDGGTLRAGSEDRAGSGVR
jgi:hypothetical protein